jgi:phage-related protein
MSSIGVRCHELRIEDLRATWRVIYYIAADAVVILGVFAKKTPSTPQGVIDACKKRLKGFQDAR